MSKERVGFVLCSSVADPLPSTRIAVLNILPLLQFEGLQPCILFDPPDRSETPDLSGVVERAVSADCSIVVLQKVSGPGAVALVRQLSALGVRTIFSVCDRVDVQMAAATDATIVVSDFLRSLYPLELQSRIYVVHDGIENPHIHKIDWGLHNTPQRAVLVTSSDLDHLPVIENVPSWLNVRIVGRYGRWLGKLKEMRWKWSQKTATERVDYLKFLINPRVCCTPWGAERVYQEMLNADVGIIPISTHLLDSYGELPPEWMRKSENRLTLKMSIGLPVIATPIPSYEAVIDHGRNGFLAVPHGIGAHA